MPKTKSTLPAKKDKGWNSHSKVTPEHVRDLASLGLTLKEICTRTGLSQQTIHRNFKEAYETGRNSMKDALRSVILNKALKEQYWPAMKHLAEVHLGWRSNNPNQDLADSIEEIKQVMQKEFVAEFGNVVDVTPKGDSEA